MSLHEFCTVIGVSTSICVSLSLPSLSLSGFLWLFELQSTGRGVLLAGGASSGPRPPQSHGQTQGQGQGLGGKSVATAAAAAAKASRKSSATIDTTVFEM